MHHFFRFANNLPLNESNQNLLVNVLEYWEENGDETKYFCWITDFFITRENAHRIMRAGRARWKIENETFSTLKNQGYHFEHNFGLGQKNLSMVFVSIMMLAFLVDQIQQMSCPLFRAARQMASSTRDLWEKVRAVFYLNDFHLKEMTYAGTTAAFTYDNDGLLTKAGSFTISHKPENGLPDNVTDGTINMARGFNGFAELDQQTTTIATKNVASYSVIRFPNGKIKAKTETIDGAATNYSYEYDEVGRLKKAYRGGVLVEEYHYDANGNRVEENNVLRGISRTLTPSAEDQCQVAGDTTYQTDKDGFVQSKTTPDGITTYTYSSRGELLKVVLPDTTRIEYVYDPLNRRIAKKVNGTVKEKYLWQGGTRLLAVFDGSNNLLMRFSYAADRLPVSMVEGASTYYFITDQVGSIRAVVDTAGTVVKRIWFVYARLHAFTTRGSYDYGQSYYCQSADAIKCSGSCWDGKCPVGCMPLVSVLICADCASLCPTTGECDES